MSIKEKKLIMKKHIKYIINNKYIVIIATHSKNNKIRVNQ